MLRLSAQLQQVSLDELHIKVKKDLTVLEDWATRFDTFASQQGKLDVKWIQDRYDKGKIAVTDMMNNLQNYLSLSNLNLAHAEIVTTQAKHGQGTCKT